MLGDETDKSGDWMIDGVEYSHREPRVVGFIFPSDDHAPVASPPFLALLNPAHLCGHALFYRLYDSLFFFSL
jgi:hypothetical protein